MAGRAVLMVAALAAAALAQQCNVPDPAKRDCGHIGTTQQQCQAAGG